MEIIWCYLHWQLSVDILLVAYDSMHGCGPIDVKDKILWCDGQWAVGMRQHVK